MEDHDGGAEVGEVRVRREERLEEREAEGEGLVGGAVGRGDGVPPREAPDKGGEAGEEGAGEEAAANLIRVNDVVILRTGFPATAAAFGAAGYETVAVDADEAARVDGGLSCMSLRCNW